MRVCALWLLVCECVGFFFPFFFFPKAVVDILVKRFVYPIKMMKTPFISVALWPGADRSFTLTSFSNTRQRPTNGSAGSRPILDNTRCIKHKGVGTQTRLFTSNFLTLANRGQCTGKGDETQKSLDWS